MRTILAALLVASAAAALASAPAGAESSYWDGRAQAADGPRLYDPGYDRRDHVDIRIRKPPRGYDRPRGYERRSYNGPVYQSQEQVQQSVHDFATGGVGDINAYR